MITAGMRLPIPLVALACLALSAACVDLSRPGSLTNVTPSSDGGRSDAARDGMPDISNDGPAKDIADGPLPTDDGSGGDTGGDSGPAPDADPDATAAPDAPLDTPVLPPDAAPDVPPDTAKVDAPPGSSSNGTTCNSGTTCLSGLCVDGVCCATACGACSSCNQSGMAGKCLPIAAGQDPDNDCTASPPETCGFDGACNGAGACRLYGAGTTCNAGSCSGSTAMSSTTCDGAGHCGTPAIHECAPYLCGSGICRSSCGSPSDCKAGYVCTANACVPSMSMADAGVPDAAPPGNPLLVDDFADATLLRNTMGGQVTWDNMNVTLAPGGVRFSWDGNSTYDDFIETFLASFCAYDIRSYRTLRFRISASVGPRTMRIFLPYANNSCDTAATPLLGTVSVTTTMSTFDVDLTPATNRGKALFIEFSPAVQDNTSYLLDDVQLLP
jgi:hypothetical protein